LKGFDAGVDSVTQPAAPVRKAKTPEKSPMVAIYDANGNLVGMADPDDITVLADAKAPGSADAAPTDLEAAPAASVGTPADAVPAAKSMSAGAEQRGAHQLGGATPRGGVPVVPAEDVEEQVAKARAMSSELKKALVGGGRAGTAAEANQVAHAMNAAAIAKFAEMQRQGRAPGTPRR
jgi:hypothetical protein